MALFDGLKKAFGFSDKETDSDVDEEYLPYGAPHQRTPYINPFKKDDDVAEEKIAELSASSPKEATSNKPITESMQNNTSIIASLPSDVFDGLIGIINANLPQFVKECVDVEAEKKALSNILGPQFEAMLQEARDAAIRESVQEWEAERQEYNEKLLAADTKCSDADKKVEEAKAKQLNEESQRKIVLEKKKELEQRIATLEAEHEQFELENKSLLNKVKVAQVYAEDAKSYRDEIVKLNSTITELRANSKNSETDKEEILKLNDKIAELEAQVTEAEGLQEKLQTANDALASLQKKYDEINNEADKNIIQNLQKEISERDSSITGIKEKLKTSNSELEAVREELNEAYANLEIANEIQEQLDKVDDFKKRKNEEIVNLNAKITALQMEKTAVSEEMTEKLNKSEEGKLLLQQQLDIMKTYAEEIKNGKDTATEELNKRVTDLKNQVASAATLIEQRDATIEQMLKELDSNKTVAAGKIKSDATIAELDQKMKFMQAEHSRIVAELKAQIETLKATKAVTANAAVINDDMREAVEEVFDINLSSNPVYESPTTEVVEPKDDNVTDFSVDDINETFSIAAEEPKQNSSIPAIEDIADINWLMPAPPIEPEPIEQVLEEKKEPSAEEKSQLSDEEQKGQQLSLF